jgi:hypothetical protein
MLLPFLSESAQGPLSTKPPLTTGRGLQGRGSNSALARGEAESLFREHVDALQEAAIESYLDLLEAELRVGWWSCPCSARLAESGWL